MKVFTLIAFALAATPAFAGTGVQYTNDSLGFTINASAMDDTLQICDQKDHCLDFVPTKLEGKPQQYSLCDNDHHCRKFRESTGKNVARYKERTGKCEIEMEAKTLDYGGFMFELDLQLVRVTRGTEACQLTGQIGEPRQLWGIYQ